MKNYVLKALSNYEGHKYVETQAERIAEGDLAPRIAQQRRDPVTSHKCERCLESKKTSVMVKIRWQLHGKIGHRVKGFVGHFVLCCEECAAELSYHVSPRTQADSSPPVQA